jgi:3-oxoacyl-[acyl-carrier protein] reductase
MQRRSFTSATAASASASHTRSYDLVGRTAIVTGGRTGLGSAIVHLLVEQGVRVVVASRRAGEDAAASEKDARIIPILCDVRDPKQVEQMVETANRALGGIDIVVHAAGVNADALIVRATDASVDTYTLERACNATACLNHPAVE